jgi:hypothetical protein
VWAGMAAGLPGWTALEEGRSKLLFAAIPSGSHVAREVAIRAELHGPRRSLPKGAHDAHGAR